MNSFPKTWTNWTVPRRAKSDCSTSQLWGWEMERANIWALSLREISEHMILKFSRPRDGPRYVEAATILPCHIQFGITSWALPLISFSFLLPVLQFLLTYFRNSSRYSTVYILHIFIIALCRTNTRGTIYHQFPMYFVGFSYHTR